MNRYSVEFGRDGSDRYSVEDTENDTSIIWYEDFPEARYLANISARWLNFQEVSKKNQMVNK